MPVAYLCRSNTHLGGVFTAKAADAIQGVQITIVYASHANNVPLSLLSEAHRALHAADNTSIVLDPPTGYVVKFTNGLVAYLSGDTGITAEHDAVVRRFFNANLVVMNIGGIFSTGPQEAAWVVNELVQPQAVIASHANEAATQDGEVQPDTKTAAFIDAVKVPVQVPLSGRTMEFDGEAACVTGC